MQRTLNRIPLPVAVRFLFCALNLPQRCWLALLVDLCVANKQTVLAGLQLNRHEVSPAKQRGETLRKNELETLISFSLGC
jgi:hypothetical protein